MAHDVQIVIDSPSPHALADWWAEALGWQVEPQDEAFIRRMVAEGHATEEETVVHEGALRWRVGTAIRSPDPGRPRVLFQAVPEPKTVKNRLHLDVHVGDGQREPEVARLVGMGATELWRESQGPYSWVTSPTRRATSSASPERAQQARRSRASLRETTVRSAIWRTRSLCLRRSGPR